MTCVIRTATSRTNTESWEVCASASASGSYQAVSVEVASEVCTDAGEESTNTQETEQTISTEPGQPVVACQQGKTTVVAGQTYVALTPGFQVYAGQTCKVQECPSISGGGGDGVDDVTAASASIGCAPAFAL